MGFDGGVQEEVARQSLPDNLDQSPNFDPTELEPSPGYGATDSALHPGVGRRSSTRHGILEPHEAEDVTWEHGGGFKPDASNRIAATDLAGLERRIRY